MKSFNVFDEWGNYAGKFTPSGGGADGCLGILALITAGVVFFALYMMVKLIIEGTKALFKGDWGMAIVGLSPIWLSAILLFFSVGTMVVTNQQKAQRDQQSISELRLVTTEDAKIIRGNESGPCAKLFFAKSELCWWQTVLKATIANGSQDVLHILSIPGLPDRRADKF